MNEYMLHEAQKTTLPNSSWPNLKTGPAKPGHATIALDITAVEFDQLSLYSSGTMFISLSL